MRPTLAFFVVAMSSLVGLCWAEEAVPISIVVYGAGWNKALAFGEMRPGTPSMEVAAQKDALAKCHALLGDRAALRPSGQSYFYEHTASAQLRTEVRYTGEYICSLSDYSTDEEIGRLVHILLHPKKYRALGSEGRGRIQEDAIRILGTIGAPAVAELLPHLQDGDIRTRRDVIRAIAETASPTPEALTALSRLQNNSELGDEARQAIRALTAPPVVLADASAAKEQAHPGLVRRVIEQIRRRLAEPFALLSHSSAHVRAEAVSAVGGSQAEESDRLHALVKSLKDSDEGVFLSAADELAKMDAQRVLPRVLPLLDSSSAGTRAAVCALLTRMGPRAISAKAALLQTIARYADEPESLFYSAETALTSIGLTAVDTHTLVDLLHHPRLSPARRAEVIRLLAALGPDAKEAIPDLYRLVAEDLSRYDLQRVRSRTGVEGDVYEAVLALAKIGPSDDSRLNTSIARRLQQLSETDHFNVPAWLRKGARQALSVIHVSVA